MTDLINARPNLNGNTPEHFTDSGRKIHSAAMDVAAVLNAHIGEITNGRNYQHLTDPAPARAADLARVNAIRTALKDLESLGIEIYQRGTE